MMVVVLMKNSKNLSKIPKILMKKSAELDIQI